MARKTSESDPKKAVDAGPSRDVEPFSSEELQAVIKSLLDQKEELSRQLHEIEEGTFHLSQSEMSGEVSYDEDPADAGSFTFEREKDLSIANNLSDLLDKIDKALHKIELGTYGLCEFCQKPIDVSRVKALPYVSLCIRCKKAEERR
ncbi:MAG: TraR/DksA family transcriptional regulator [Actinomycetota bacterium]